MLGIARAAQYAGWGSRAPEIKDITTTTVSLGSNLLQRPSYYADFTGVTYSNTGGGVGVPTGSAVMDMTGIGTDSKKQVWSTTFRVGSAWMSTAPSSGFESGFGVFHSINNNGTSNFASFSAAKNNNAYNFGVSYGPNLEFSAANFDANFRNRWLTAITCTSSTPVSDFANWTGGATDPFGNGWGSRTVLIDTESGALLAETSGWNYSSFVMDLSQAWELGTSSSYNDNHFVYFAGDISQYNRNDVEFLSHWIGFGGTFDPLVNYALVTGPAVSSIVLGTRAWVQWDMASGGTLLTNGSSIDFGYEITVGGNGSRMPAATKLSITGNSFATVAEPFPTFVNR